ncbi:hypothetical protein [Pseudomonas sp. S1(2024)]|uniref:hypothetical protein n=1 Tax=Pseudomonas sp. S1(2024) TaxID=3390191 RepID=UPI0039796C4F
MSTDYYVDFDNQTNDTWTLAVYQTLPSSVGLDSVSWKQTTVPTQGYSGVEWTIDYNVVIANYRQVGGVGVYKASQTLSTQLGSVWDCVFKDNVQQLVLGSGSAPADSIQINNKSNLPANLGIGMSGQGSVFKPDVVGSGQAQFKVTPTYYLGLFQKVQLGEVISSNVVVGPREIKFPSGMNCATATARMDGANIKLTITYSEVTKVSYEATQRLIAARQERLGRVLEHA